MGYGGGEVPWGVVSVQPLLASTQQLLKASWISDGGSSTASRPQGLWRSHSCPTCPAGIFHSRVGGAEATGSNRLGYLYLGVCPSRVTDAYRGSVLKFCNRHEQSACTGLTCCLTPLGHVSHAGKEKKHSYREQRQLGPDRLGHQLGPSTWN